MGFHGTLWGTEQRKVNSVIFGQKNSFSQSGYDPQGRFSQIWLKAKDESKTSFIKSHFLAKILETM